MIDKDLIKLFAGYQAAVGQMQVTSAGLLTVAHVIKELTREIRVFRKILTMDQGGESVGKEPQAHP